MSMPKLPYKEPLARSTPQRGSHLKHRWNRPELGNSLVTVH